MVTNVSMLMMMKKMWFVMLLLFACTPESESPKPVEPVVEDPQQYGTPFANVVAPQEVVMYEVSTRAYSKDGNFQGVIDRLDNIKALGINTIWLMPIHPVSQERSAGGKGSPYAVQNYMEVNPEFGDLAKLRELVQKAHERNMSVIIDWVANHTSWDNPWIKNKAWYTQDGNGNIIIPAGTNWQDVADLNYDNADMRKEMIKAMKYWVLQANIDGFRCDAVDFVPTSFWKQAITELKKIEGHDLILLAEGGKAENFDAGFQMNYAWDFFENMRKVFGQGTSANTIFTTHQTEYNAIPAGALKLRYTTNHDQSAWEGTPITMFNGKDGALAASAITLFISAAPLIYSSQEVGRQPLLSFFDNDPIDWTANQGMLEAYTKMLTLYTSTSAFKKGTLTSFNNADVAMFKRTLGTEEYLIIANVRNETKEVTVDEVLKNTNWKNALDATDVAIADKVTLQPYEYWILKK